MRTLIAICAALLAIILSLSLAEYFDSKLAGSGGISLYPLFAASALLMIF